MKRGRVRIPLLSEDTLHLSPDLYLFDELRAGILSYISERYLGSFVIEEGAALDGYVYVAKEPLCFFVRLLLNDLFGKTLLRASYGQTPEHAFYLRFCYDKGVQISDEERFRLLRYASLAKVEFRYEENETEAEIRLLMPFHSTLFESVYMPMPANQFFISLIEIELDEKEDRDAVKPDGDFWNLKPKGKF